MRIVLEVLQETGSQSSKTNLKIQLQSYQGGGISGKMDCFEPHDRGEPIGRNLAADGKNHAGPVLVGALTNMKKGVKDGNEGVRVDGEQGKIVEAFIAPRDEIC